MTNEERAQGYIDRCDECAAPIPLSEAGALCPECEDYAEQERRDGEMSEEQRLGIGRRLA